MGSLGHQVNLRAECDGARLRLDEHFAGHGAGRDVLMFNADGFAMETTIHNVAVQRSEESPWVTPELSSGLLDGVARRFLLDIGALRVGNVTVEELRCTEARRGAFPQLAVLNSVRGVLPAVPELQDRAAALEVPDCRTPRAEREVDRRAGGSGLAKPARDRFNPRLPERSHAIRARGFQTRGLQTMYLTKMYIIIN